MPTEPGKDLYARMFSRHAHPWSAWSRLLTTPLLLVPVWTRKWWLYAPIGAWFAVNPVLAPTASDETSLATRAMRGEEMWSRDPASDVRLLALSVVGGGLLAGAFVASYRRRAVAAVASTAAFMGLTLYEWRLFADRYDAA